MRTSFLPRLFYVDNTVLNLGSGGDTIASDDISAVKYQRIKLTMGADGVNEGDVSSTNPIPVKQTVVISTANSSTAVLGISGVFTGTSEDISAYSDIRICVFSDVASATDGLSIQQSTNGTNWDFTDVFTIPAATGKVFSVGVSAKFFRIVYTNGGTGQASFRLQTIFHSVRTKPSTQRPQDGRSNDNDFEENLSYLMLFNGTNWDRGKGDITNGLDVDVTRMPNTTAATAVFDKITDGTNTAAVKAASTAAATTDPALVVSLSPNVAVVPTYRAATAALLVPAVTANVPWFIIQGSASKTIKVQRIGIVGLTLTAVAYLNINAAKYSTALTGGTATALTKVPSDSAFAAATANLVQVYTAIPTAGTKVGDIDAYRILGQATTATATGPLISPYIIDFRTISNSAPIVLRGTAEGLGLYWQVAPATTPSFQLFVEWSEE